MTEAKTHSNKDGGRIPPQDIQAEKSLLGAIYTLEWSEVWCECSVDIYQKIEKFVV